MTRLEIPLVTTGFELQPSAMAEKTEAHSSKAHICQGTELPLCVVQSPLRYCTSLGLNLRIHQKIPWITRNPTTLVLAPQSWHLVSYHLVKQPGCHIWWPWTQISPGYRWGSQAECQYQAIYDAEEVVVTKVSNVTESRVPSPLIFCWPFSTGDEAVTERRLITKKWGYLVMSIQDLGVQSLLGKQKVKSP